MCLFAGEWPLQEQHQRGLLQAFIDAYRAAGGPSLSLDELTLRLNLTLALSFSGQVGVPPLIYRDIPRDTWPSIRDRFDPRIDGSDGKAFLARSYAIGMVYRFTRWKRDGVYEKLRPFLESL